MAEINTFDEETFDNVETIDIEESDIIPLSEIVEATNLVDILDEETVTDMGRRCREQYNADEESRKDWLEAGKKGMEMALQIKKPKNYPFEGASNVIYPLITTAAIQFAARAMPGIFPGRDIVKAKVIGDDSGVFETDPNNPEAEPVMVVPPGAKAAKATRVSTFMSWQLLEEMENWEADTDSLLHYLPIAGCAFRKTWRDNGAKSKFIPAKDLVVNMSASSLADAPQVSEIIELYPHQIRERVLANSWDKEAVDHFLDEDAVEAIDFVEAHCLYDLDEDGYPEPYIVTFPKKGDGPVRIVANFVQADIDESGQKLKLIKPTAYYTKYDFIPNPDGGFYGIGFGWLLGPINASVNTAINQLNDAAHWQNAPAGFIGKGLKLKAGDTRFKPGEFKPVDSYGETIKNNIVNLDFGGPSPTTFQLLSLLIDAGRDISSVKDIMMGSSEQNLAPTTILTLVEQGTKQFVAIYKRIHRALKHEMRIMFKMNAENIEKVFPLYQEIVDDPDASPEDFAQAMNIMPITDPDMVTDGMAMAKSEFLMKLADQGRIDPQETTQRVLEAANISDPQSLALKEQQPDPEIMLKMAKLENDKSRIATEASKVQAEIINLHATAIKNLAQAEAEEQGTQIALYNEQIIAMEKILNEFGSISGVAGQPVNAGGVQSPQGAPAPQGV